VRVSAESADHSVIVSVEDDGAGISSEVRPHLFEPFATAGKRHGMGLGLALSKRTILDHGGEIWADSTTGPGARFLIRPARLTPALSPPDTILRSVYTRPTRPGTR